MERHFSHIHTFGLVSTGVNINKASGACAPEHSHTSLKYTCVWPITMSAVRKLHTLCWSLLYSTASSLKAHWQKHCILKESGASNANLQQEGLWDFSICLCFLSKPVKTTSKIPPANSIYKPQLLMNTTNGIQAPTWRPWRVIRQKPT